jgi:hypothetical protein
VGVTLTIRGNTKNVVTIRGGQRSTPTAQISKFCSAPLCRISVDSVDRLNGLDVAIRRHRHSLKLRAFLPFLERTARSPLSSPRNQIPYRLSGRR